MKTLLIVRPANDNLLILPFHQSNKVVACDCHCFNNCLISKVCAQISNSLSYTQISKRPSAAITMSLIYHGLSNEPEKVPLLENYSVERTRKI